MSDAAYTARFLTDPMQGRLLSPAMLDSMRTRSFWSGGDMLACGGRAFGHSG